MSKLPGPENFKCIPGNKCFNMTWSPVKGAVFYNINFISSPMLAFPRFTTSTNYTAFDIFNGFEYIVAVQAVSKDNIFGELSSPVIITSTNNSPPIITNITYEDLSGTKYPKLTWTFPSKIPKWIINVYNSNSKTKNIANFKFDTDIDVKLPYVSKLSYELNINTYTYSCFLLSAKIKSCIDWKFKVGALSGTNLSLSDYSDNFLLSSTNIIKLRASISNNANSVTIIWSASKRRQKQNYDYFKLFDGSNEIIFNSSDNSYIDSISPYDKIRYTTPITLNNLIAGQTYNFNIKGYNYEKIYANAFNKDSSGNLIPGISNIFLSTITDITSIGT
jgi:hypothetical protein